MRVLVNGVYLYFDVEGAGLVPEGGTMKQKPTLLMLHGGPGADHTLYKPTFSALTDVAQVIYLDHRGNGRSEHGNPTSWTLAQWGDDVHAFCQVLGIESPIVYGASFGGMVAMAYATRHPTHPGKLILVSTAAEAYSHPLAKVAMFERLGGSAAGALAHRRFVERDTGPETLNEWFKYALPLYTQTPQDPEAAARIQRHPEVTLWFNQPGGQAHTINLLPALERIKCPTLVMGGVLDPMLPIECQRDIVAALKPELVEVHEFEACGHGVIPDVPDKAMPILRKFIAS